MVSQPFRITWGGGSSEHEQGQSFLALGDRGGIQGYPYMQSNMEKQGTWCSLLLPEEPPIQLTSEGPCPKRDRNSIKRRQEGPGSAVHYTLCQEERDTERTTSGVPWTLAQPTSTKSQQNTQKRPHLEKTRKPAHLSAHCGCGVLHSTHSRGN